MPNTHTKKGLFQFYPHNLWWVGLAILAIILDRLSDALSKYDFTGVDRRRRELKGALSVFQLPAKGLAKVISLIAPLFGKKVSQESAQASL